MFCASKKSNFENDLTKTPLHKRRFCLSSSERQKNGYAFKGKKSLRDAGIHSFNYYMWYTLIIANNLQQKDWR